MKIFIIRYLERYIHLFVIATFSIFIFFKLHQGIIARYLAQNLDSAGYVEAFKLNGSFELESKAFLSAVNFMNLVWNPDYSCDVDQSALLYNNNYYSIHLYLLPKVMSILLSWTSIPFYFLAFYTYAVIYTFMIIFVIIYLLNKLKNQKTYLKFLLLPVFLFALNIWPPLLSGFQGQLYLDKLLIPLGFLFILINEYAQEKSRVIILQILGLLIALVSERGLLLAGALLFYMFLKSIKIRENKSRFYFLIGSIFYFVLFLYWREKIASDNFNNLGNLQQYLNRIQSFSNFEIQAKLFTFFSIILLPLILALVMRRILDFFLMIALIMPNILLTIGGAELDGYLTHYHSLYAGVYLGLFTSMFASVVNADKNWNIISGLFIASAFALSSFKYYESGGAVLRNLQSFYGLETTYSQIYKDINTKKDIVKRFEFKTISTVESFMPIAILGEPKELDLFPLGVGTADFLILPKSSTGELDIYLQPWVFQERENDTRDCLSRVINQNYEEDAESIGKFIVLKKIIRDK